MQNLCLIPKRIQEPYQLLLISIKTKNYADRTHQFSDFRFFLGCFYNNCVYVLTHTDYRDSIILSQTIVVVFIDMYSRTIITLYY